MAANMDTVIANAPDTAHVEPGVGDAAKENQDQCVESGFDDVVKAAAYVDNDETDSTSKSPAHTDPAPKKYGLKCKLVTLGLVLIALALAGVTAFLFIDSASTETQAPSIVKGKHADVATDVHIVDDVHAESIGDNALIAATAGAAPFFHKWFGNPSSKAFHHDGGAAELVSAKYTPPLAMGGCYEVHEWHPSGPWTQMSSNAAVDVAHLHGNTQVIVDQSANGGQWNFIGSFDFQQGGHVVLSNKQSKCTGSESCYTSFDAFRFVYTAPKCESSHKAAKSLRENAFVYGSLLLKVPEVSSFTSDAQVTQALKNALSSLANVKSHHVSIVLSSPARRLSSLRQLAASVIVSYRITASSDHSPSSLADALDSKTAHEVNLAISEAFSAVGSTHVVQVIDIKATLDHTEISAEITKPSTPSSGDRTVVSPTAASVQSNVQPNQIIASDQRTCKASIIINDFDSEHVKGVISPGATEGPGMEAFRAGKVGSKPYFKDWFGDLLKKDFHHDAAMNKGLVQVEYTTPLPDAGCYMLEEWHLGGNQICRNYMPKRVPFQVHTMDGVQTVYADQSVNGGQWNALGLFQFSASATVVMSNAGTDDCTYGTCYTIFDSIRLVHVGSKCSDVEQDEDAFNRMSELACDSPQPRLSVYQSDSDAESADYSPVKLLDITSPSAATVVKTHSQLKISWETEGLKAGTIVSITLFYNDENLGNMHHQMLSHDDTLDLQMPSAEFLRHRAVSWEEGANNRFRVRIDVQHEIVETSNGWSDQLYAYSPYFTVEM